MLNSKILITIVAIIIGSIVVGSMFFLKQEQKADPQLIAEKTINYINHNLLLDKTTASLVKVEEKNQVYKLILKIGGREFTSYVSKDGKFFFPEGYDLEAKITEPESKSKSSELPDIPKTDVPDVKLFVMSYCPFGLQMQKAFLPVYKLLKDKAKMGIYFVNYAMHGKKEIDENLLQYCIQKEEKSKFYDYLSCFVVSGNSEKCRSKAGINEAKIENCLKVTDQKFGITRLYEDKESWLNGRFPKFPVYTKLCENYEVRGSPTVVINGTVVRITPRSPENFKDIICSAMSSSTSECSQNLSDKVPSAGLGEGAEGRGEGQCK